MRVQTQLLQGSRQAQDRTNRVPVRVFVRGDENGALVGSGECRDLGDFLRVIAVVGVVGGHDG